MSINSKEQPQMHNDWQIFILFISISIPLVMLLMGCQIKPTLSETRDFNEDSGRVFVHHLQDTNNPNTKVMIDGEEVSDLGLLDQFGIKQSEGEHEIEFVDLPLDSGISEIDYKVQKNKDLHLFYCKGNGSFHWFMMPQGKSVSKDKVACN